MREEVHLGLGVPQKFLFGQEIVEHLPVWRMALDEISSSS